MLSAAAVARLVADEHAARWTAVATAALSSNLLIDVVAVKGELLALPVLMAQPGLALVAVRDRSWPAALAAGLLAGLALGLKQNLAGGLVFAAVLFVGAWLAGRLARPRAGPAGRRGVAGLAVPVLATVGWALAAGVRLHTLWYAVYGFRSDAAGCSPRAPTPLRRVGAGLLPGGRRRRDAAVLGGFVVAHPRRVAPTTHR